ncbi:MAG: hypothetical protein ACR2OO_09890 [Thermomicrobiales bacterium]
MWEYLQIMLQPEAKDLVQMSADDMAAFDSELAELGAEGWELVSAVPIAGRTGTVALLYAFKRPLADESG